MNRLSSIKRLALVGGLLMSGFTTTSFADTSDTQNTAKSDSHYFRHIMFRETPYASYRGIYPLEANGKAELKESPDVAHYEFKYDGNGRVTSIAYQMKNILIRRNEVWDSFIWFAPKVEIDYQSDKEIHTYFNTDTKQIAAHGNVWKAVYQLDSEGRRKALNFYDKDGNASESAWNVHRYEWQHKNEKIYEKRFNLKDEQQTMRPELHFHEVELEYDNDGKLAFMRNLGLTGTPTNNSSGAGIDRVVYDHNGNFVRWMVYDKDGNAVEGNNPNVHLGEHLYDQYGNKVGLRGFDRHGKQIPFSWGALEHVQTYYPNGNQKSHVMYNADGSFDRHLSLEYSDDNSEITWLRSRDENGQLAASAMLGGAAAMMYVYQDDGNVERQFFNADMSEFTPQPQSGSH